ncbi:hypothetical protein SAMN05428949_0802 [Chitinophaga sp. YR627]|uniref:2Fe-2S iron-sulfur cluster-binding protein n=1 Tax=Chitinophaga sp. YR627 TaxID=1881041 RepID=UPI0008E093A7|nr:2Fe-2S iron-sulfur cluster-binding protein [Chitinophaga sp. YR627]SFM79070.1 hypothetical protein SAMN05428949_0802 [Chitinophaga sp. YR627]
MMEQNTASTNNSGKKSYTITLSKSNKQVLWTQSKGTILELCESAGLSPDYNCRMGTCSTCESKLISGAFTYDPEPFMEPEEGNILICCAIPASDMEIEL